MIEIRDEVEAYEKDKDKTLLIKKLNLELKILKQDSSVISVIKLLRDRHY